MDLFQSTAVMQYLSEYPEDITDYQEILGLVSAGDDSIVVWQPFEHWEGEDVAGLIDDMADCLKRTFSN